MSESDLMNVRDKVIVNVDPGACRLHSHVVGWIDDDGKLRVHITSDCRHVVEFGEHIPPMDILEVLRMPYSENCVYVEGGKALKHATCAVPLAVLKCLEVAGGMGVKKDVHLTFQSTISR
jgi:hypothetical protein